MLAPAAVALTVCADLFLHCAALRDARRSCAFMADGMLAESALEMFPAEAANVPPIAVLIGAEIEF